jgi:anti-sigma factor RsiW
MLTCFETDADLPRYFAGRLSKCEREGVRTHLSVCSGCAERAAEIRSAMRMIRDSVTEIPEPRAQDVPDPLLRAVMMLAAVPGSASTDLPPLNDGF